MVERHASGRRAGAIVALAIFLVLLALPLLAQEGPAETVDYRSFFGGDSRLVIWIVAQLHLMFGAFVLGVPIFALVVELMGIKNKDPRYDWLAREFTKLLSAAFATTAALGGLLAFTLFTLYPKFMAYLAGAFSPAFYVYALLFFGEGFSLYLYMYSWDSLTGNKKWVHIMIGIMLNVFGTLIMMIANSWASYMMTPTGIEEGTGRFIGTTWQALTNPLWMPLNIHRFLGNIVFGGFVVGAYAAIRFLIAKGEEQRAHYDWMGYVGNFVGLAALIPLPFAGYYIGREIYSASPLMGNVMMGGAFSWTFIIQAMLVGMLFIVGNFYLWSGMRRIPGAERYTGYIKYVNIILIVAFAVWLTPHNLPLTGEEQMAIGGQYHPLLKFLGLMSAKNAVVNLMILSTFFVFLLYRRGNKGATLPFSRHGNAAKLVLGGVGLFTILFVGAWAYRLYTLNPEELNLTPDRAKYFILPVLLLLLEIVAVVVGYILTLVDRGKLAQTVIFAVTTLSVVIVLGIYGFVIMEKANPFLRHIAVSQFIMVLACLIFNAVIDIFLFKGAEVIGEIRWGRMTAPSQYALVLLCMGAVLTMGLMGFIRSGLREEWHIYGVMRDTSQWAFTPTMAYMSRVISIIVFIFLGTVAFLFWLTGLEERGKAKAAMVPETLDGGGSLPPTRGGEGEKDRGG